MPVLYCRSSDPYPLPCPQFQKIQCLEYNTVVGLHRLLCSFCSCCIVSFGLTSCRSKLPASWPLPRMELPPILRVRHDIHVSLPEPKKSCAMCTILPFSFTRNVLYTFLKWFIIHLIGHCLCFFLLPIKKFLTVVWLSYHYVCKRVRKFTWWLFHCFYKD